jgi:hypothetical protein
VGSIVSSQYIGTDWMNGELCTIQMQKHVKCVKNSLGHELIVLLWQGALVQWKKYGKDN